MSLLRLLDRDRIIAPAGYARWRIPPAGLAIHLSIGQAYAFSVFNLPLTRVLGITASAPGDWALTTVGWVFSIAIVCLGLSAFAFGAWIERAGPRKAMFAAACCFGGGFLVAALGVHLHRIALLYLGYGVLGGIGLGLGYIAPVSTLMKWFPDRPGMATGLAIMGFGGGAMIGSPLAMALMRHFATPTSTGVAAAFVVMGILYFAVMCGGAWLVRLPAAPIPAAPGTRPAGPDTPVGVAMRTPAFRYLWVVLCLNVTAGIGVLGQAAPMVQEMFPGRVDAAGAARFVVFLSAANMVGRFLWSSASDRIGRPWTYALFFALGALLYAAVPAIGRAGDLVLFVAVCGVLMTMYGGGFATIPAYLRDHFGTMQVGAIHGRLLTAWSVAGVAGPVLVNYLRQARIDAGTPPADAYAGTLYIMAGLLAVGFLANLGAARALRRSTLQ